MLVNFVFLYDNGVEEIVVQECTFPQFDEVVSVINESMEQGLNAVIRLNGPNESYFVSMAKVTRVKFVIVVEDPNDLGIE
jgi:hypothetical protein